MTARIIAVLIVLVCGSFIVGCSESATPTLTSVAAAQLQSTPSDVVSRETDAAATVAEVAPAAADEFEPPFPHREDLFNPPAKVANTPERPESASDVKLRGFVNVDGVKALLVINGQITPTVAGQQYAGIDVISIEPPQVTLQRGRVRWTEKLYQ